MATERQTFNYLRDRIATLEAREKELVEEALQLIRDLRPHLRPSGGIEKTVEQFLEKHGGSD